MEKVRVRFAPSPTGYLHVGNARTALFNWLFARQKKGISILRIEDTDEERSVAEYENRLIEDLRWLGLDWDEGPDVGGDLGPYRQSLRLDIYKSNTQKLLETGKAYPCFCPPDDIEKKRREAVARGRTPVYGGRCRSIPLQEALGRIDAGEQAAIRLRTPEEGSISYQDLVRGPLTFDLKLIGDPILVRSSGLPAYNYAVVVDDALMEITHVIRGEDHISNTPRQLLTYQALDFCPPQFAHLSMVMGKDNTRLSKRHGATSIEQFDNDGILPDALLNYLAMLGWYPPDGREILEKHELVQLFDLTKVSRSSAIFDYDKLHWINRQHIKKLSVRQRTERAYLHLKEAGFLPEEMTEAHWEWLEKAVETLIERIDRFSDLPQQFAILFEFSLTDLDIESKEILKSDCAMKVIRLFGEKIAKVEKFDYEQFAAITQEIKSETDCKGKHLYHPLRVTLTTKAIGLDLDKFIPLVEEGAQLSFPRQLKNCSQRTSEMLSFLA